MSRTCTICYLLINSRADTVQFCLLYWSWVLLIGHNCCLLAMVSITSLSAKKMFLLFHQRSCRFTRDGWMCNYKTKAWCKQSIWILIFAQTNCTAECLHTVVLRTTFVSLCLAAPQNVGYISLCWLTQNILGLQFHPLYRVFSSGNIRPKCMAW